MFMLSLLTCLFIRKVLHQGHYKLQALELEVEVVLLFVLRAFSEFSGSAKFEQELLMKFDALRDGRERGIVERKFYLDATEETEKLFVNFIPCRDSEIR